MKERYRERKTKSRWKKEMKDFFESRRMRIRGDREEKRRRRNLG